MAYEDVDYCLRVFAAGLSASTSPPPSPSTTRACSAAAPTRKIERWQPRSRRPAASTSGATPTSAAFVPEVAVTDFPAPCSSARGNGAVAWYRCALPAMALGADWVGVAGEPPRPALRHRHGAATTSTSTTSAATTSSCVQQVAGAGVAAGDPRAGRRRHHRPVRGRRLAARRAQARATTRTSDALRPRARSRRTSCACAPPTAIICSTRVARPAATARSTRAPGCAATASTCARYALTRPQRDHVGDRLGRRHRPRRRRASRGSREVGAVMRERARHPLRQRRPALRAAGSSREFGAERCLAIPFTRARDLPGGDDALRHRARARRQGQLLPRQERPALARGQRARASR